MSGTISTTLPTETMTTTPEITNTVPSPGPTATTPEATTTTPGAVTTPAVSSAPTTSAGNATSSTPSATTVLNPGSLSQQDALFVQQAMNSGLQEIAEGNLAIQQSGDHVAGRNFGRWMAADHTHLNDEILAVAQLRGAQVSATAPTIPTALSNSETGDQFVSVYATEQVVDHQQAIMLFTAEANGGTDVNLVALARAALPLLNAHLLGAQDLVTAFPANDTMSDNTTGGTTVNDGSGDQTVAGNDQTNDNGSGDTTTTDGTNDGTTDQTVVDQANTDGLTDATTTDGTTDGTLTIADMINNAGDNNTTVNDMAGTVPGAQPQDLVMTAAGMSAGEPVTAAVLMPDFQTT